MGLVPCIGLLGYDRFQEGGGWGGGFLWLVDLYEGVKDRIGKYSVAIV